MFQSACSIDIVVIDDSRRHPVLSGRYITTVEECCPIVGLLVGAAWIHVVWRPRRFTGPKGLIQYKDVVLPVK